MLTIEEIKTYIDKDAASKKKKAAELGQRYYDAEHDILKYRIMFIDEDGVVHEDLYKTNTKISHPFFTEIADQEVQHLLSNTDSIFKSDIPELQTQLDEYFNNSEEFMSELYDVVTDSVVKGFGYAYAYKSEEGRIAFQCADSIGVIEVRANETLDQCDYVIFWYSDHITRENKTITRIQVWDKKQRYFYVREGGGQIQKDESEKINPLPHIVYTEDGDENTYFEGFGFIPFFRLDNNRKQTSGLKPIKALIDDYDLMACGLSNNIKDMSEAYLAVKGFEGDNFDELALNFRAKKHIGVGEGGDIDIKTVDIPYQAREAKMERDERDIYRFAMAFNATPKRNGNVTDDEVESRYELLNMKCNKLETRLKEFFRKLLRPVLDEINEKNGTDYRQKDVYFDLKRKPATDKKKDADIALVEAQKKQVEINTVLGLREIIDDETIVQLICEQLDIDYEDIKDKLPAPAEEPIPTAPAKTALEQITPEDGDMSA